MELSKIIAKLVVEILSGTEEEDEYAAALYLRACEAEEADMMDDDDDDEEDLPIEEAESDEEDVDFIAKQMELLEEDAAASDDEEANEAVDDADKEDTDDDDEEELENEHVHDEHCDHEEDEDPINIPHGRGAHLSALFFRTFMRTILQNWAQMDKYRIDKFYTMLRFMLERVYSYCASRGWNMGMIRLFNDGLCDEVLAKLPNGVRCHLIDVCLDELVKHEADVTEAVFLDVVQPFLSMAQTGVDGDDLVHNRAVENVLERFLDKYSVFSERSDAEDAPQFSQVHVGTVAQFVFELASDDATLQRYRSRMYEVYKKYMKRIHEIGEENDVDIARVDLSADEQNDDEADTTMDDEDSEHNPVVEMLNSEPTQESRTSEEEGGTKESSGKKKKKKRKKKTVIMESSDIVDSKDNKQEGAVTDWKNKMESEIEAKVQEMESESDIVISIEEQRKAKIVMKTEQKNADLKKRQRDEKNQESKTAKKVKFGEKNLAKSHKASMKALRQASPPAGVRPDRGILRNKDAKIALRKPKASKKRRK